MSRIVFLFFLIFISTAIAGRRGGGGRWQSSCPSCANYRAPVSAPQAMPGGSGCPGCRGSSSPEGRALTSIFDGPYTTFRVDGVDVPTGAQAYYYENGRPHFVDAQGKVMGGESQIADNASATAPDSVTTAHSDTPPATNAAANARPPGNEGNRCSQIAGTLPAQYRDGKLVLDPKDDRVKRFMQTFAPHWVGEQLAQVFGEKEGTRARLDKLKDDPEIRNRVFETLAQVSRKENPAAFARGLERLLKLPEGLLTDTGNGDGGFDPKRLSSLDDVTKQMLRDMALNKAKGGDFFRYFNLFKDPENEKGWQDYCLVCAFAVNSEKWPNP